MSRHWVLEPLILSLAFLMLAGDAEAGDLSRLADLSLEDLLNLEVVSVSKREEQYLDTAAATYVLTSDDITRLGASSIAEALRAVP